MIVVVPLCAAAAATAAGAGAADVEIKSGWHGYCMLPLLILTHYGAHLQLDHSPTPYALIKNGGDLKKCAKNPQLHVFRGIFGHQI